MRNATRLTLLVTGSSGLIGTAVCNRFGRRFNVVGFDRAGPPHPPPSAECVCVDITSDESVREAMQRVRAGHGDRIASVIHLAAYYDFSGAPSEKYETVTIRGTERLLRELQAFEVEQFVFSSTMLVHAPCDPGQRINEDGPIEPKWNYPQSKVATEKLIHAQRGHIPAVILRIAGVYDDRCHSLPIAHQIQRIYERMVTSRVYPGDLARGQAFVHLADLVDAIDRVVERRKALQPETTFLLGEPETLSYGELQREFGRLIHNEEWETKHVAKSLAKAGARVQDAVPGKDPFIKPWMIDLADDHYALDISRARKALGWEPRHALRDRLPRMVAALKADPVSFYRDNDLGEPPARLMRREHEPAIEAKEAS